MSEKRDKYYNEKKLTFTSFTSGNGKTFSIYNDCDNENNNYLMDGLLCNGSKENLMRIIKKRFVEEFKSTFVSYLPLLIKIDRNSKNQEQINLIEYNLAGPFSFFNNSSIWVRLVDKDDKNAYSTAVAEFEYFDKIGLYDYASAWENLEYNLRIFAHDYLESSLDGHGNYVTPILYGNETESLGILQNNNIEITKTASETITQPDNNPNWLKKLWQKIKTLFTNLTNKNNNV